jgi:hypothetical protein
VPTSELVYHDRFGSRIWSEPRGRAAGYRWPQYSIHRAELQHLLLHELRAIVGRYSRTAGFDVDELNARPSWNVAGVTAPAG